MQRSLVERVTRYVSDRSRRVEFVLGGKWLKRSPKERPTKEHIEALLEWIFRAQAATPDGGVAESFHYPTQVWRPSYPETTGYIICSVLRAAAAGYGNAGELREAARRMGEWLVDVQLPDGSFQGGNIAIKDPKPAVFNTGQILKGLTDLLREGLDSTGRIADSAARAARWLVDHQDADGAWRRGISVLTTEPVHAYNVRTAWALARYGHQVRNEGAVQAGIRNGEWLLGIREPDGWFPLMNFDIGVDPLLHTVAYTIRGLLELGDLCGRADFVDAARQAARSIATVQDPETGAVPGQLSRGYRPAVTWTNTTANSQMAIIWFRLAEITGEPGWAEHGRLSNRFNRSLHEIDARNPGTCGALRGSWPSHQGYGRYWYMNWTQKFFVDALLAESGVRVC